MSAERPTYVDSSALVKLAVREPESQALRAYLRRRRPLICSALARTEIQRALLPLGEAALQRGRSVLASIELIRLGPGILDEAGTMRPAELRSLNAIHLATAALATARGPVHIVTYDDRMAAAARQRGWRVASPA